MAGLLYERVHYRHDPRWLLSGREGEPGLCLACVIEMMEDGALSVVRKKHVLSCLQIVLRRHSPSVTELLAHDGRVCAHFIGTLLGMLQSVEDGLALDLVTEILVQLIVDLKSEQFVHCALDECHKELCKVASMRGSLPAFTFLGKLLDAVPNLADILVTAHCNLTEHLARGLMYPNEAVKAAVCYVYGKLYSLQPAAEKLSRHFTDKLCGIFLATLETAQTKELQINCMEFLFEHLMSTSEVLTWSLYCCLLLMTEERLFFSKCHTVYGIESVVRSLKDVLRMDNMELHKQGLLLLTEILKRQPVEIKLFTNPGIFKATTDVLQEAVISPVLEVAVEAISAAAAFLRKDHLSTPVQYSQLQELLRKILERCADLPLPPVIRRPAGHPASRDQVKNISRQGQLLTNALRGFHNACRLALECQRDPSTQENAFTAPNSESEDTLETFSSFLLKICDSLCIPTVMKYYEIAPIPAVMEIFFSVLCDMFAVVPSMKETFSMKLASASFIRLTLEVKSSLCAGQSNPNLNRACSDFLCSLCCTLWSATREGAEDSQNEVSEVLQRGLIHLDGSVPQSLSLLVESPNNLSTDAVLRCRQHSLLIIFCVAYVTEDRFIPETDLFWAVRGFLQSVQSHGDHLSPYAVTAAVYLLAVCQDKCEALNGASLNGICRILEGAPDLRLIYSHHPLFLKFFLRYPQLLERFGRAIMELWISHEEYGQIDNEEVSSGASDGTESKTPDQCISLPLLNILHANPNSMLILLDLICTGPVELAHKVLVILKTFLTRYDDSLISDLLRSRLLQVLQRILVVNSSAGLQADKNLPLTLSLLYLVQLKSQPRNEMDSTDFKLLYHVSNLSGKCRPTTVSLLQPSFNFLYCSVRQANTSCRMRAAAMLLSNTSLIELIERILELTWTESPSSPSDSCESLCCSAWLVTSSLVCFQHSHSLEVHRTICVDVDKMLNLISFRSKEKSSLLIVGLLQLLKAALRLGFSSSLLTLVQSGRRKQPLAEQDAALQPLDMQSVLYLVASLQNLLVQKDLLLVHAIVGCLESLLDFLYIKNKDAALHVASQPWNRFLLLTCLSNAKSCFLQPGMLRFMTLFVKYGSANILLQNERKQILDEAAKLNVSSLPSARDLRHFLLQLQNTTHEVEPAESVIVQKLLQDIGCIQSQPVQDHLLCLGGIIVSRSHVAE
ncbi:meiosis inhibitor protein 1 isoform X2 [Ascaphus truei]|uniref:meiosis inhibitor protein 1 isoform X2 n=1 Tax=Ascaphus truei TaxID=8439 RepID=UPI003F59BE2B